MVERRGADFRKRVLERLRQEPVVLNPDGPVVTLEVVCHQLPRLEATSLIERTRAVHRQSTTTGGRRHRR